MPRCGACHGRHDTVAEVRSCHQVPAPPAAPARPAPGPPPPAAAEPAPVATGTVDPMDAAIALLAAAGIVGEVLLDNRNDRRSWARRR